MLRDRARLNLAVPRLPFRIVPKREGDPLLVPIAERLATWRMTKAFLAFIDPVKLEAEVQRVTCEVAAFGSTEFDPAEVMR